MSKIAKDLEGILAVFREDRENAVKYWERPSTYEYLDLQNDLWEVYHSLIVSEGFLDKWALRLQELIEFWYDNHE
jgi:hypothetical protein